MFQCPYCVRTSVCVSGLIYLQNTMAEVESLEQKSHDLSSPSEDRNKLTYLVADAPPWYLCIFLAIQVDVEPPAVNFIDTAILCSNFVCVFFPHPYFIHLAASSDSIWGNGLNPPHSF